MKINSNLKQFTLASSLVLASQLAMAADQNSRIEVSTGVSYSVSEYTNGSEVTRFNVPLSLSYKKGAFKARATVPYKSVTAAKDVIILDEDAIDPGAGSSTGKTTREGLGDTTLSLAYKLSDNYGVEAATLVKLPTADEKEGLGTGEVDYAAEIRVKPKTKSKWDPYGELGYKVYGDTPARSYNNVVYASLGTEYRVSRQTSVGTEVSFREANRDNRPDRKEWQIFADHKLTKNWEVGVDAAKGLGDSTRDWKAGASLKYTFAVK